MKTKCEVVSASTLDELVAKVRQTPNIVRFHELILPAAGDASRHSHEEIPYRRWSLNGATRYDACMELGT